MQGKTVVFTGGTSGLGEVGAVELARRGARVLLVARDEARGAETLKALREAGPGAEHALHLADLSRMSEMKRVAREIAGAEPRIDVLVNNAGAIFGRREETADGLERTFAVNHMAYLVVTEGLLERLKATPGARIVSTASTAHQGATLDFDDLQSTKGYNGLKAYGRSKLANILFTRELARRLEGSGVTANCHHPGVVATRFGDNVGWIAPVLKTLFRPAFISPEKGAQTLLYLATSPAVEGRTGGYYDKSALVSPSAAARDDAAAARLWTASQEIAAKAG